MKLGFTIDTDYQGDFIRFEDKTKEPIYGDKEIIRFLFLELLKENK